MDGVEAWASGGSVAHQDADGLIEAPTDDDHVQDGPVHGQLQLRVDLAGVSDAVPEWALDAVWTDRPIDCR